MFLCGYINVNAEEENVNLTNEEITEENNGETNEISNEIDIVNKSELPLTSDDKEDNDSIITPNPTLSETEEVTVEVHKVAVITNKVDDKGNQLIGAVLQIIDSEGNVVDEWISDGTDHISMLPEGDYILHEVSAPEGYKKATDQSFTVKVEEIDLDAGVDFSETPCNHYGGTPLYYIESNGVKEEVYCINQDWETPDENSNYDGNIITPDNIRDFTNQTIYIDAQQNKEKRDVSDQTLSNEELYNKILDIIYHRQQASKKFKDLSEAEIRYVTESALKNYTNAGLTRVQGVTSKSKIPAGALDTYYDGRYYWYLYPWYRSFTYNPDAAPGYDIYTTTISTGDAFGNLARHWNDAGTTENPGHNAKGNQSVREKVARYYELYQYLISDIDRHPEDMHLYVYSTNDKASKSSGFNFDDGTYQNLIGIKWFNPYDENYKVELKCVNVKTEIVPPITGISSNNNNSSYLYVISLLLGVIGLSIKKRFN